MVALGGLTYDSASESQDRVPWLSKIPIIGYFFKNQSTNRSRSVLVIFIESKIVKDDFSKEKTEKICNSINNYIKNNQDGKNCPIQKLFFEEDSVAKTFDKNLTDFLKEPLNIDKNNLATLSRKFLN